MIDNFKKYFPFYVPDITENEIENVVSVLRSGWITTGAKVVEFENTLKDYCLAEKVLCVSSATAGLELILRLFNIGEGDEVITTPYTFAATANVILHVNAKPVFVDVKKDDFNIDPTKIANAITNKTKAIIAVDFAGLPADYNEIIQVLENNKKLYSPSKKTLQRFLTRALLISDAAHSFGAIYNKKVIGTVADFTVFSFHAVKNITSAEGGAIAIKSLFNNYCSSKIYQDLKILSLHGQDRTAFTRKALKNWRYNIKIAGFKYNMTDINAAIGLSHLQRYKSDILAKRKNLSQTYVKLLSSNPLCITPILENRIKETAYHIFPLRILGYNEKLRDEFIWKMAENNIFLNVHYIPLVSHDCYKNLGFSILDYSNADFLYQNEVTLPLYNSLTQEDIVFICDNINKLLLKK